MREPGVNFIIPPEQGGAFHPDNYWLDGEVVGLERAKAAVETSMHLGNMTPAHDGRPACWPGHSPDYRQFQLLPGESVDQAASRVLNTMKFERLLACLRER